MRTLVFSCRGLPHRATEAADLFNALADAEQCRAVAAAPPNGLAVLGTVHLLVTMGDDPAGARPCAHRSHRDWPLLSPAMLPDGDARASELLRRHVCGLVVRQGWDRRVALDPQ